MAADRTKQLERLARRVYGVDWQEKLSEAMLVDAATVWRWKTGKSPIPEAVMVALRCLDRERKS